MYSDQICRRRRGLWNECADFVPIDCLITHYILIITYKSKIIIYILLYIILLLLYIIIRIL